MITPEEFLKSKGLDIEYSKTLISWVKEYEELKVKHIPTADEFLNSFEHNDIVLIMAEFAKMHCRKQIDTILETSIIHSYPIDLIK